MSCGSSSKSSSSTSRPLRQSSSARGLSRISEPTPQLSSDRRLRAPSGRRERSVPAERANLFCSPRRGHHQYSLFGKSQKRHMGIASSQWNPTDRCGFKESMLVTPDLRCFARRVDRDTENNGGFSFRNTEFALSRQSWSKCQIEQNSSSRPAGQSPRAA
jgi:hypothetical protein